METRDCYFLDLGLVRYKDALEIQNKMVEARRENRIPDLLILVEHPPVFTLGKHGDVGNILIPVEEVKSRGIELCRINRGGDVTYHGPGQLVGYPIIDLKGFGRDLHWYVRCLEQLMIDVLSRYGVNAHRDKEHPGVWVGDDKIGAVGIAVESEWITMHGFAFNINPNMEYFQLIHPCGIKDKGVASLASLIKRDIDREELLNNFLDCFAALFGKNMVNVKPEDLGLHLDEYAGLASR